VVAFISGAVIMGLELAASRLLAPHFGYSIYIWGSLLGVIMLALAIGYFLGGWLIDKNPTDSVLYKTIFASAILTAIIPIHSFPILSILSFLGLIWGSLISTTVIFGPPMVLLAMVSPMVIRLKSRTVEGVGETSGFVYAVSTVGSILGTFVTAFYLIPDLGTQKTILGFSIVLFMISFLRIGSILRITFLVILPFGFFVPVMLYSMSGMAHHTESEYNVINVYQKENLTILMLGYTGGSQTVSYKNQTLTGRYYDYSTGLINLDINSEI